MSNILPKYCFTCKISRTWGSRIGVYILALKSYVEDEKQEGEENNKKAFNATLVQKRYINGKIFLANWNPTSRRFWVEKDTHKFIGTTIKRIKDDKKEGEFILLKVFARLTPLISYKRKKRTLGTYNSTIQ